MATCPSVARLMELKDVDEEKAKLIRKIWKTFGAPDTERLLEDYAELKKVKEWHDRCYYKPRPREVRRRAVDAVFGTCGVEVIGRRNKGTFQNVVVYYCNAGDTYAPTLCFVYDRMFISTLGDEVESGKY